MKNKKYVQWMFHTEECKGQYFFYLFVEIIWAPTSPLTYTDTVTTVPIPQCNEMGFICSDWVMIKQKMSHFNVFTFKRGEVWEMTMPTSSEGCEEVTLPWGGKTFTSIWTSGCVFLRCLCGSQETHTIHHEIPPQGTHSGREIWNIIRMFYSEN